MNLYSFEGAIDLDIVDLTFMIRPYNSWKPEQISDHKTILITGKVYWLWLLHHYR